MTVAYHLRGYDKTTERLGVEHDIPASMLPMLKTLISAAPDDPDLYDPYEISGAPLRRLAGPLAVAIDPVTYDYVIESDEDPQIVADMRDALRARA